MNALVRNVYGDAGKINVEVIKLHLICECVSRNLNYCMLPLSDIRMNNS